MFIVLLFKIAEFVRFLFNILTALKRDVKGIIAFKRILKKIDSYKELTAAEVFFQNVRKHPNKECIVFEKKIWTFKDVN